MILNLEQIAEELAKRNLTKVHYKLRISRQTLSNIVNGTNQNPSYEIVKSLSDYLTTTDKGDEYKDDKGAANES